MAKVKGAMVVQRSLAVLYICDGNTLVKVSSHYCYFKGGEKRWINLNNVG